MRTIWRCGLAGFALLVAAAVILFTGGVALVYA
ncbi:MAG: hypothetical protein JWQ88_1766, partial [Rhodoferax sp.]|nr:hypothetical protein [Rhodoferax sp.]